MRSNKHLRGCGSILDKILEDASAPAHPWTGYNPESYIGSSVGQSPYTNLSSLVRVTDWMGKAGGPYYMKPSGMSGDNFSEQPQT